MCHVCPPIWAFSNLEKKLNITVRIGLLRLSHIFLLSLFSVVPSFWPVFGFIFSTGDRSRNLCIWWRAPTTSNDVIFMSKVPSCQLSTYLIHRIQLFLSLITSPKKHSKVWLVTDSAQSDFYKEPIKGSYFCKNVSELIRSVMNVHSNTLFIILSDFLF